MAGLGRDIPAGRRHINRVTHVSCRPRRLPRPAHPREKAGLWVWDGEIPRDPDCPLEQVGFELSVPHLGKLYLAAERPLRLA